MSGRSERERRAAARERLSAAGITPTKTAGGGGGKQGLTIAAVILVVAVAAGLIYAWQSSSTSPTGAPVAATYQVGRSGTVVTAGAANAPVTVDVYEDFLCPACQQFEQRHGDEITTALNQGKIKVNYHVIAILDEQSTPPGYSTLAGNAGLCAADAGIWPAFHDRVFAEQPAEGGPGRTAQELAAIGQQLGARGEFASCVTGNGDAAAIAGATTDAAANPAVAPDGGLSTPTVLVGGKQIEISDRDWLRDALGA